MKTYYLIQAFDSETCDVFIPDPALYETEQEAEDYCEEHCGTVSYSYRKVKVGKFKKAKKFSAYRPVR
jgi:hypothetical protein